MKRLISFLLIIILGLSFTSCKRQDTPDAPVDKVQSANKVEAETESEHKEQTPPTQAEQAPPTTDNKQPEETLPDDNDKNQPEQQKPLDVFPNSLTESDKAEIKNSNELYIAKHPENIIPSVSIYYKLPLADKTELINKLISLEYNEDQYRCANNIVVSIGQDDKFKFYIENTFHHISYGANTHTLTEDEAKWFKSFFDRTLRFTNTVSIKGKHNKAIVYVAEQKFEFENENADKFLALVTSLELKEGTIPHDPEYSLLLFEGQDKFTISLKETAPYVAAGSRLAILSKEHANIISKILEKNCK